MAKNEIRIIIFGKTKTGKTTVKEIIYDALRQNFDVSFDPKASETPSFIPINKRIRSLQKNNLRIEIAEIQASERSMSSSS